MIIGTAGHIDHGKTSLVARLTGKNTDRLPEEKRRGISIELGYAYLSQTPEQPSLGFVDVPGHEKFVHAMLSGATGIDYALLVIAADDGPMPQTYEHLDILRLLGVTQGAVVLTKIDAVDVAAGDQAVSLIAQAVAGQPAEHWPLFPVSSVSGEGIEPLRAHLFQAARLQPAPLSSGEFRLAVDRAFSLQGLGTIVTGTVRSGSVCVGDEVRVLPGGRTARVRSLHANDQPAQRGTCGQRLALNLVGLSLDEVSRGDWLCGCGLETVVSCMDVALDVSAVHGREMNQGIEVHLHHGTEDVLARVFTLDVETALPGTSCLAHIQLSKPIAACARDRFVIRDSQARTTLGGGLVLDVHPPRRARRAADRLAVLKAIRDQDAQQAFVAMTLHAPRPLKAVRQNWNLTEDELLMLLAQSETPVAGGIAFHPNRWQIFREKVLVSVDEIHLKEPEMPGMELNRLRRIASPQLEADAFAELVDSLVSAGELVRKGVFVSRPSHKAELSTAERNLWQSIAPLLDEPPYNPPRVRDIANLVNIPEAEIRANLRKVARVGEVTLVALDHFFLTHRVAELADIASDLFAVHGSVRAADFRDRIGGGRKVAIQILEFFDRVGFTRRMRDEHVVRRSNPFLEMSV